MAAEAARLAIARCWRFWHARRMRVRLVAGAVIALAVSAAVLAVAPAVLKAAHLHWPVWPLVLAGASITALAALGRPLTAVITRSWADRAQQQISSRDQARQIERDLTGYSKGLPLASQVSDRAVLGIHPAIPLPPGSDPALPADLPLYIPRDIDSELRAWVTTHRQSGGFLLLTGPAAAGKTRTACQLIHDTLADWPLLMPATAEQLTTYIHATPTASRLIIWLNETQNYLGPGRLSAAAIRRILTAPRPVIIIGTIWPQRYDALTTMAAPASFQGNATAVPGLHDPSSDAREILTILAHRADLPSAFTIAEQDRAHTLASNDPRLAEALSYGPHLPQTLAAAPDLIHRWLTAADPAGAAVITAAVTARRCGHPQPLPPAVLQPLAEQALTPSQRARARRGWYPAALRWAQSPVRGLAAPLTPQARAPGAIDGDNVSDILIQHATSNPAAPWHHIPEATWLLLISHATPAACLDIAATAYPNRATQQAPIAQRAARKAAGAGHPSAMDSLGTLLHEQGSPAQAEQWYRTAAHAGHSGAMANLAFLLAQRGDDNQAEQWYRTAAEAGHFGAMSHLAVLLAGQGHPGQAAEWHRKASHAGQITAEPPPAAEDQHLADQAEQRYRRAAGAGDRDAMAHLGFLLAQREESGEAEYWYRKAAAAGNTHAMNNLAILLAGQGHSGEAEHWYRKAIGSGGSGVAGATFNLGSLYETQENSRQAEQWYRTAAAMGHTAAMTSLGALLARQGLHSQAEQWYRKAAAAGDTHAMRKLESPPGQQGETDRLNSDVVKPS
jgi:hypothetical protein